jgi:hypothetical protein
MSVMPELQHFSIVVRPSGLAFSHSFEVYTGSELGYNNYETFSITRSRRLGQLRHGDPQH